MEGFYIQYCDAGGIPIRASAAVAPAGLDIAARKIEGMLQAVPDVRQRLIAAGAEFHIIGRDEVTSDLPEHRRYKTEPYIDVAGDSTDLDLRTRGVGGLWASCGEENLLGLPGDRYAGHDICVHEFAHTIMDYGLDEAGRAAIATQYERAMAADLWRGAYAATNAGEYWAELSGWFFGARGHLPVGLVIPPGTMALRAYDPAGWALLAQLYNQDDPIRFPDA